MSTSACPDTTETTRLISDLLADRFEADPAAVQPNSRMGDLLVDSLMVVEMAIALYDTFGIRVGEDELRDLTVGELGEQVATRKAST